MISNNVSGILTSVDSEELVQPPLSSAAPDDVLPEA